MYTRCEQLYTYIRCETHLRSKRNPLRRLVGDDSHSHSERQVARWPATEQIGPTLPVDVLKNKSPEGSGGNDDVVKLTERMLTVCLCPARETRKHKIRYFLTGSCRKRQRENQKTEELEEQKIYNTRGSRVGVRVSKTDAIRQ